MLAKSLIALTLLVAIPAFAVTKNVQLKNGKGEEVGTATVNEIAKGVKIDLDVHGLTPGPHAFHIHEKGQCAGPKFDSAGGHFAPAHQPHGFDNKDGYHAGDMANVMVGADGSAKLEIINTNVTLGSGANSLLKPGGTAFVLHEKADDYKSQPAGDAGGRVACGAIL